MRQMRLAKKIHFPYGFLGWREAECLIRSSMSVDIIFRVCEELRVTNDRDEMRKVNAGNNPLAGQREKANPGPLEPRPPPGMIFPR